MNNEREDQEPAAATTSDWLDESIAFLAANLDLGFNDYGWLSASEAQEQHDVGSMIVETLPPTATTLHHPSLNLDTSVASSAPMTSQQELGQPKKRKSPGHSSSQRPHVGGGGRGGCQQEKGEASCVRSKPIKKGSGKGTAANSDRETRWAEQLLNPCAAAIEAGNLPRTQHLLYVLGELASFSGEPNHRLAAHGLRALTRRLPHAVGQAAAATVKMPSCECPTPVFSGVDPRLFRASLIRFNEVSPWFAVPNALANSAIAQARSTKGEVTEPLQVHVVDIGVSHGVQWPTLFEALTRVPRGSTPPSVRLTVAGPTATPPVPFSASPPGYDCSPQLLRYAKSIDLDLGIVQAPCLDTLHGTLTPGETLIVCLQFRLGLATADEQAAILRTVRDLNPELMVLTELDGGGGRSDYSAASEFAARLELLWRFLDSTAAAFKGMDADERRVMEAEAVRYYGLAPFI